MTDEYTAARRALTWSPRPWRVEKSGRWVSLIDAADDMIVQEKEDWERIAMFLLEALNSAKPSGDLVGEDR